MGSDTNERSVVSGDNSGNMCAVTIAVHDIIVFDLSFLITDEIDAIGDFATLAKATSESWMLIKANRNRPRKQNKY